MVADNRSREQREWDKKCGVSTELAVFDLESLVGLPVESAREAVEGLGGYFEALRPGELLTLSYDATRIRVLVEDGRITRSFGRG